MIKTNLSGNKQLKFAFKLNGCIMIEARNNKKKNPNKNQQERYFVSSVFHGRVYLKLNIHLTIEKSDFYNTQKMMIENRTNKKYLFHGFST